MIWLMPRARALRGSCEHLRADDISVRSDRFKRVCSGERNELLKFINTHHIENVVFGAAANHVFSVNNLTYQDFFGGPQIVTERHRVDTMAVASLRGDPGRCWPRRALCRLRNWRSTWLPPSGKDDFLKTLIDKTFLAPLGYDPIGLDDNLPTAAFQQFMRSCCRAATLCRTTPVGPEFNRSMEVCWSQPTSPTAADLASNPTAILASTPTIVSQFRVTPAAEHSENKPAHISNLVAFGDSLSTMATCSTHCVSPPPAWEGPERPAPVYVEQLAQLLNVPLLAGAEATPGALVDPYALDQSVQ